jgi:DNA-binding transcriptional LysR family regulator
MIMEPDRLFGVEARHLAALGAIAKTRSFSKAGEELGYAQSAISQQLAALERAVGHQLVDRPGGPRPVSLTEAGTTLLRHGEVIIARLSAAKADLDALAAGQAGLLRVGTFQSAGARLLPPTLARFRARWPKVQVVLEGETNGEDLDQMVLSGKLDLAFSVQDKVVAPLEFVEILRDPYFVLAPHDHPLANRAEISLHDLDGVDVISSDPEDSCCQRLVDGYRDAGATPNFVYFTNDNLMEQRLVSAGVGCTVMPALAIEDGLPGNTAVIIPLAGNPPMFRTIGIAWHGDRCRSTAAQAFVEVAREVAQEESLRSTLWGRR